MEIGNKIFELRKKNNFSQEQLAEKMGVARQTISKWELSETAPDIKQAKELSKLFQVSLDELADNDLKNILVEKLNATEKVVKTSTRFLKMLVITLYVVILLSCVLVAIHFITKKDFTSKYQTEFRCVIADEIFDVAVELRDDNEYYLTYLNNDNMKDHPAGKTLVDVYKTLEIFKKFVIGMGGTCR